MEPKTIGIAVVESQGRFLVGTRREGQVLAGAAEFPGGKCEVGESPQQCAVRECLEETGLRVEPLRLLEQLRFEYPHGIVDLHFWLCREVEPAAEPQHGFQWVSCAELRSLKFPTANESVVRKLLEAHE